MIQAYDSVIKFVVSRDELLNQRTFSCFLSLLCLFALESALCNRRDYSRKLKDSFFSLQ